jgi:2',3'-cyclic-nucleotide 2'-phosphodiesterase (5'-nucleotidase family)
MARRRTATALLLLWFASPDLAAQRPLTVTISVIATTDLHGGVLPRGDRGGLALLGGYLSNLRAARLRDGGGVLLVDSGDMFQGTLESNLNEGSAVVRAYNGLGYAAAAIGNHEFDYGPVGPDETAQKPGEDPRGALKARAAEARFPFLAANTVDDATGQPVAWPNVKPSTIVTVRGVQIGLIGVTTPDTPALTIGANVVGLTFTPLVPVIIREATSLRARGATVVVVLAHAGGRCTKLDNPEDLSSCDQMAEVVDVVHQLPMGLVDVIAAGHTHRAMAHDVSGIAIVEAYSSGRSFSRIDLTVNRSTGALVGKHIFPTHDLCAREDPATHTCDPAVPSGATLVASRYENRTVRPDAAAAAAIAPAVRHALTVKNQPIGVVVETPFVRGDQQGETALADLVADATLAAAPGADVALSNGGSLRGDLPPGPLTYGALYELYPFDNRVVTLAVTGEQLARIVAFNLTRKVLPSELLPIAGFKVDARCESNLLRVTLTHTSGMPIRADERLQVATSDFIAGGGDGILVPAGVLGPIRVVEGAPLLRESVVAWLRSRGGRLTEHQFMAPENRRWNYPGSRPMMCQ